MQLAGERRREDPFTTKDQRVTEGMRTAPLTFQ
jgi:hypothetical protein